MANEVGNDQVFVIMQFGSPTSSERQRADEIAEYVIKPALVEASLQMYQSDLDATPGQITPQIIKKLIDASVVVADLTGRNPNVYYELGIAHSFGCPVIVICDSPESLAFDTKDERVITLGDWPPLAAPKAAEATRLLKDALKAVLTPGYRSASIVSDVANSRSLHELAPENPLTSLVAELTIIRDNTEDLLREAKTAPAPRSNSDLAALTAMVETLVDEGKVKQSHLLAAKSKSTSESFNKWIDKLRQTIRHQAEDPWDADAGGFFGGRKAEDPWAADAGDGASDEPPF